MDGGDDENFEEIGNPLFLPADHPLLNNLQNALNVQLSDEYERVHLEYLEKSSNLKKVEKEKEDIGVQLYGLQQQLADMQLAFEKSHEDYNSIQKLREDKEKRLTSLSENLEFKQKEIEELKKKVVRATDELSRLNLSLKQVEAYNEAMKKEIKKTKRVTHTAEENVTSLEKQKKMQDLLIDQMNEEIKRLNEQRAILGAQLLAQAEETENAKRILRDAQTEMDKIYASKKNLLEHWTNAIIEIQKKDKNLQMCKDLLKIQAELNIKITSEMNGIEKEIDKENENSAMIASIFEKLKKEERILDEHYRKLKEKKNKIEAKIKILKESLKKTEEEIKRIDIEQKTLEDQVGIIENNIMKLHTETKKKMEEIVNKVSEHKTIEKTSAN
jgi:chromosome segregation ATPase